MMLTEYFLDWARGRGCAEAHVDHYASGGRFGSVSRNPLWTCISRHAAASRPAAGPHSTFSLSGGDDVGDDHGEAVVGRAGCGWSGSFVDGDGD